jgi:membrane-associated protease RseP (regulator of RpoE activity)
MVRYPKLPSTPSPEIGYVVPDGAAAKAGVREGDRVVQIGDAANPTWEDIEMKEVASAGHELPVWIARDGERKRINITPVLDPRTGVGFAGWAEQNQIEVANVSAEKPAALAGLQAGDMLVICATASRARSASRR